MNNVIDISDFRKKRATETEWLADISLFRSDDVGYLAKIIDANPDMAGDDAAGLRLLADALFQTAWLALKLAQNERPDEDHDILSFSRVYASGRVNTQIDDDAFVSERQMEWLKERFEEATDGFRHEA